MVVTKNLKSTFLTKRFSEVEKEPSTKNSEIEDLKLIDSASVVYLLRRAHDTRRRLTLATKTIYFTG